jgi:hypothetical protein
MRLIIDDLINLMETKGIHTILSAFLDRIITLEAISFVKGVRDGNDQ